VNHWSCRVSDLHIVAEIITQAEQLTRTISSSNGRAEPLPASGAASSSSLSFLSILQAYDSVLLKHGRIPENDVSIYQLLLRLNVNPEADWWRKFDAECQRLQRWWSSDNDNVPDNAPRPFINGPGRDQYQPNPTSYQFQQRDQSQSSNAVLSSSFAPHALNHPTAPVTDRPSVLRRKAGGESTVTVDIDVDYASSRPPWEHAGPAGAAAHAYSEIDWQPTRLAAAAATGSYVETAASVTAAGPAVSSYPTNAPAPVSASTSLPYSGTNGVAQASSQTLNSINHAFSGGHSSSAMADPASASTSEVARILERGSAYRLQSNPPLGLSGGASDSDQPRREHLGLSGPDASLPNRRRRVRRADFTPAAGRVLLTKLFLLWKQCVPLIKHSCCSAGNPRY